MRGFVSVELPNGLAIREMPLLVGKNGPWVSLAAKPQIDGGGQVRREPNGKIAYAAILQWRSHGANSPPESARMVLTRPKTACVGGR